MEDLGQLSLFLLQNLMKKVSQVRNIVLYNKNQQTKDLDTIVKLNQENLTWKKQISSLKNSKKSNLLGEQREIIPKDNILDLQKSPNYNLTKNTPKYKIPEGAETVIACYACGIGFKKATLFLALLGIEGITKKNFMIIKMILLA